MKKKGVNQIDWVLSLTIFLLYLLWFFVFVRPMFEPEEELSPLLSIVYDGFKDDTSWQMKKVPVFIWSNVTEDYYPIILNMSYPWVSENFSFDDNDYFFFSENRVMFLKNLSNGTNVVWLVNSDDNYTRPNPVFDIDSEIVSASIGSKEFRAEYVEGLLYKIRYKNITSIKSSELYMNNIAVPKENNSYNSSNILAKYQIQVANYNVTSYVFAENTVVHNYIDLDSTYSLEQTVRLSFSLYTYPWYYANNERHGLINYSSNSCSNATSSYFDFYGNDGISFLFDRDVEFSICYDNSTRLGMNITFTLMNNTRYRVMAHQGSYTSTTGYLNDYTYDFGAIETITGRSMSKLTTINATSYSTLKFKWGFPDERDFSFLVKNASGTEIFNYDEETPPLLKNVYVNEQKDNLINKYGNMDNITIVVRSW